MTLFRKDAVRLLILIVMLTVGGCAGTNSLGSRQYQADFEEFISFTKDAVAGVGLEVRTGEYLQQDTYQITAVEITKGIQNQPVQSLLLNIDLNRLEDNTISVKISSAGKRNVMASSGDFEANRFREKIFNRLDKMTGAQR